MAFLFGDDLPLLPFGFFFCQRNITLRPDKKRHCIQTHTIKREKSSWPLSLLFRHSVVVLSLLRRSFDVNTSFFCRVN